LLPCVATTVTNIVLSGRFLPTLQRYWFMPLCMLAGAGIGARLFVAFPAFPYALLLAGVILLYLYLDHLGRVEWAFVAQHRIAAGVGFGFLAGLSEGTANIAAPPLLMYLFSLNLDRMTFVQILNLCFTVGKPTQMAVLTLEGGVTWTQWAATLPYAVIATAAAVYGIKIRDRIDALSYRRWLLRLLFVIALVLVVQYSKDTLTMPAARRFDPDKIAEWSGSLPKDKEILLFCAHGRSISNASVDYLTKNGYKARLVAGGFDSWKEAGGAAVPKAQ
jgi:rhodanese-related sulfurtransferase